MGSFHMVLLDIMRLGVIEIKTTETLRAASCKKLIRKNKSIRTDIFRYKIIILNYQFIDFGFTQFSQETKAR